MNKRTFNLLVIAALFTSCDIFNRYQLPDNYIALHCLESSEECITVDNIKIKKEPLLKISYSQAVLTGKKHMIANFAENSKNEIQKLLKDNIGKKIFFFHQQQLLHELDVSSDELTHITYDLSQSDDAKTMCIAIVKNCNTESYEADLAELKRRGELEKDMRAKNDIYATIFESHSWKSYKDEVVVYKTADAANGLKQNISRQNLLQDYDLSQSKFLHTTDRVKTNIGWIVRSDLYPTNVSKILPILQRNYKEYLQQLKCLNSQKTPDPYRIVSMMKRSTEIAIKFFGEEEFNKLNMLITKQIEHFKCQ